MLPDQIKHALYVADDLAYPCKSVDNTDSLTIKCNSEQKTNHKNWLTGNGA